jgi:hypothetical protein
MTDTNALIADVIDTVDTDTLDPILASLGGTEIATPLAPVDPNPSSHYSTGITSSTEDKALQLLGSGIPGEQVAAALGVTSARISQMLAEEHFSTRVAALRYETLQKHNKRDGKYDSLEDKLLDKLERQMGCLIKPESILKAIQIVNGAKRRGQSAPQQVTNQENIVNLILPSVIVKKFTTNINNQVIKAGGQELLTIPSGNLLKQVEEAATARLESPEVQDNDS